MGKKPGGMLQTQNFRNIFTEGMRTFRCHIFCRGAFPGRKLSIYRDLCLKSADFRLADGLPLFLDRLKQLDFPITIATASGWNNVQFFFDHLGLDQWFNLQNVVYNDGTIPGKPEPDLYLLAAERLGVDIHGCAVFEDAQSGIEAAKRAGAGKIIQAASMKQPHINRDADRVIRDYCDVDGLLAELGLGQPPENPTNA